MIADAVFVQDGHLFVPTDLALGPWYAGALHGGAPAALLANRVMAEAADTGLALARMTYEFVRPAPQDALRVEVDVLRRGRRVALVDAALHAAVDDRVVTRARALLVTPSAVSATDAIPPPFPGPETGRANDWSAPGRMFATDALEIRFVAGRFREPGPAIAWFRLRHPLLAGAPIAPLERLIAASDFGNGIGSALRWQEHSFINPDLTVYVERAPAGEWVALQSDMRVVRGSVAVAESVLWDRRGRIGHATQTIVVADADPGAIAAAGPAVAGATSAETP